jgi:hypothetical protein
VPPSRSRLVAARSSKSTAFLAAAIVIARSKIELRRLADLTAEPFACRDRGTTSSTEPVPQPRAPEGVLASVVPYWSSTTGSGSEGLNAWLGHFKPARAISSSHVPLVSWTP